MRGGYSPDPRMMSGWPNPRQPRSPLRDLPEPEPGRYVELHCHSCFSLREGASRPEELVHWAKALGYTALALTDHDSLAGAMLFAQEAKAEGLQSITGAEVTLADGAHLTLLCETPRGYANLSRLLTRANLESPRGEPRTRFEWLAEHAEGLIALSGCRKGEVAALAERGELRAAGEAAGRYRERLRQRRLLHRAAGEPGLRRPLPQSGADRRGPRSWPGAGRDQQCALRLAGTTPSARCAGRHPA